MQLPTCEGIHKDAAVLRRDLVDAGLGVHSARWCHLQVDNKQQSTTRPHERHQDTNMSTCQWAPSLSKQYYDATSVSMAL